MNKEKLSGAQVEQLAISLLKNRWEHLYIGGNPRRPYPTQYHTELNCVMMGIFAMQPKQESAEPPCDHSWTGEIVCEKCGTNHNETNWTDLLVRKFARVSAAGKYGDYEGCQTMEKKLRVFKKLHNINLDKTHKV